MNNWLLSFYRAASGEGEGAEAQFSYLASRTECFERVAQAKGYDLVILGGGLTGAVTAHQASLAGIRVLMLHESYFGSTAQLWSVAYRDLFRAPPLVRLKSARRAGSTAALLPQHLMRSQSLRVSKETPTFTENWVRKLCRRHVELPDGELPGCDERAVIRETILAARQEGAVCLSDVEITHVESEVGTGLYAVGVRDPLSQWSCEVRAGSLLLDPSTTRIPSSRLGRKIGPKSLEGHEFLRVVCRLQGAYTADGNQVVLGNSENTEYVFSSTGSPEVVEIVVRDTGVDLTSLVERICRTEGVALSAVVFVGKFCQRHAYRHDLEQYGGLFSPRERGPWDAGLSAKRVIEELKASEHKGRSSDSSLVYRVLPGAPHSGDVERFRVAALAAHVSESVVARAIERWHGRVRYIPEFERGLELVCADILRGEVELAYRSDQIATIEDLMFGSLALETDPDWRAKVEPLAAALSEIGGGSPVRLSLC